MELQKKKFNKTFLGIITILGWFAIITQFYLMLQNRTASLPETVVRFFGFFTILTNLIVALCSTVLFLGPNYKWYSFFSRNSTLTATAAYITIVGLVYNVILRQLWSPTGMQKLVDELLHTIIPLLFILFWFLFVNAKHLSWKSFYPWLIYPIVYLIYTLVRGAFFNFYPYPFIDVTALGVKKVLISSSLLTLVFIFFCLLFIGIGKIKNKST